MDLSRTPPKLAIYPLDKDGERGSAVEAVLHYPGHAAPAADRGNAGAISYVPTSPLESETTYEVEATVRLPEAYDTARGREFTYIWNFTTE